MLRLLTDEDVHVLSSAACVVGSPPWIWPGSRTLVFGRMPDPIILDWAAQHGYVVVSVDKKTLAGHAWDRVSRGLPMPGVAILRTLLTIGQAIDELELLALACNPDDLRNQVVYLPI